MAKLSLDVESNVITISKTSNRLRRASLLCTLLISGGLLFIPRLPILFLAVLLLIIAHPRDFVIVRARAIAALFFCLVILTFAIKNSSYEAIFVRAANFLLAIMILNTYMRLGAKQFQLDLESITKWMPFQTIATVILAAATPFLFMTLPGEVKSAFFVFNYHSTGALGLARPNGIFWEPGILQLFLHINLHYAIFSAKSNRRAISSVFAIILTQSTTGYALLGLQGLSYIYALYRGGKALNATLGILALPLTLFLLSPMALSNFDDKFTGESRGSFYARQYDTLAGISVFKSAPLLGVGFDLQSYLNISRGSTIELSEYDQSVFSDRLGNTNGIITLLFTMGALFGGGILVGLIKQSMLGRGLTIRAVLFTSLLTEPLTLFPFFLFLSLAGIFGGTARQTR